MLNFHPERAVPAAQAHAARADVSVTFLQTRVKGPNVDDWKKLMRMMCCLCSSKENPLILRMDSTSTGKCGLKGGGLMDPMLCIGR